MSVSGVDSRTPGLKEASHALTPMLSMLTGVALCVVSGWVTMHDPSNVTDAEMFTLRCGECS
jgi:hypothetical protein